MFLLVTRNTFVTDCSCQASLVRSGLHEDRDPIGLRSPLDPTLQYPYGEYFFWSSYSCAIHSNLCTEKKSMDHVTSLEIEVVGFILAVFLDSHFVFWIIFPFVAFCFFLLLLLFLGIFSLCRGQDGSVCSRLT